MALYQQQRCLASFPGPVEGFRFWRGFSVWGADLWRLRWLATAGYLCLSQCSG